MEESIEAPVEQETVEAVNETEEGQVEQESVPAALPEEVSSFILCTMYAQL